MGVGGEELIILSGVGGGLEYYGPDDSRWSAPRILAAVESLPGRVTPLDGLTELSGDTRPATLDEVRRTYPLRDYQRLLRGTDVAGKPIFFVVSALFRRPDGPDIKAKEPLHELPPEVRLTFEEMETLAPWLGLGLDQDGKTTVILVRPNPLDLDLQDGVDQVYQTRFDWNDPGQIEQLLKSLVNFQLARLGADPNPQNRPTDFGEERIEHLIGVVEKQCHTLNPTAWDKIREHALYGLIGAHTIVFTGGAFHGAGVEIGAWQGGISALLSPARWSANFAKQVAGHLGPKLAPVGAQVVKGTTGLGAASIVLGAVGAVTLGDFVGGLGVSAYMHAAGHADDPDYLLWNMAYNSLLERTMGWAITFPFGNIIRGLQGGYAAMSDEFDMGLQTAIDFQAQNYVEASRTFGETMIDQLLDFAHESADHQGQIDVRSFRAKVKNLYEAGRNVFDEAYNLLMATGHRAPEAQRIKTLIAPDGTIRDFGLLREFLKDHASKRLSLQEAKLRTLKVEPDSVVPWETQQLYEEVVKLRSLIPLLSGGGLGALDVDKRPTVTLVGEKERPASVRDQAAQGARQQRADPPVPSVPHRKERASGRRWLPGTQARGSSSRMLSLMHRRRVESHPHGLSPMLEEAKREALVWAEENDSSGQLAGALSGWTDSQIEAIASGRAEEVGTLVQNGMPSSASPRDRLLMVAASTFGATLKVAQALGFATGRSVTHRSVTAGRAAPAARGALRILSPAP